MVKFGKLIMCPFAANCLLDSDGLSVYIKRHADFGMSGIVLNGTFKQCSYAYKNIMKLAHVISLVSLTPFLPSIPYVISLLLYGILYQLCRSIQTVYVFLHYIQ